MKKLAGFVLLAMMAVACTPNIRPSDTIVSGQMVSLRDNIGLENCAAPSEADHGKHWLLLAPCGALGTKWKIETVGGDDTVSGGDVVKLHDTAGLGQCFGLLPYIDREYAEPAMMPCTLDSGYQNQSTWKVLGSGNITSGQVIKLESLHHRFGTNCVAIAPGHEGRYKIIIAHPCAAYSTDWDIVLAQ